MRSIAKQIALHPSTISRETTRNKGRPDLVARLKEMIQSKWGQQQIVDPLKIERALISHETIYKMMPVDKQVGGILYKPLRYHGKRYNKKSPGKAGRRCIPS